MFEVTLPSTQNELSHHIQNTHYPKILINKVVIGFLPFGNCIQKYAHHTEIGGGTFSGKKATLQSVQHLYSYTIIQGKPLI